MEDVGDAHPVLLAEFGDPLQDRPELRARDHGVLHVVVVGDSSHRRESRLATFPEERPLRVVLGDPDLRSVVLLADFDYLIELVGDLGLRPVELDDQDRTRFGKARVNSGLYRLYAQGVHHLDRRRHYAAADDPRDRAPGLLGILGRREESPYRLRRAQEPQGYLRRYSKRSLRAHESPQEFVPWSVRGLAAADVDYRAVGEDYLG